MHEYVTVAGHLAYSLIFLSFLMKSVFAIRVFAITASIASIFFNYHVNKEPLWVPIQWNFVFMAINIFHIGLILWEKRSIKLKDYHKDLYEMFFNDLTPGEYLKLVSLGHIRTSEFNEILIKEKSNIEMLMILYKGKVNLSCRGEKVVSISKSQFIGEMSFLTGELTTAEVKAEDQVKYFFWPKDKLKSFLLKNPKYMASLQRAIGAQLIDKILHENQKESKAA